MPEPAVATAAPDTQPIESFFDGPASGEGSGEEANPAVVDSGTATADAGADDGTGAGESTDQSAQAEDGELAALVEKFAKEYGIKDLQDPNALKNIDLARLMKRLADKERFILKLQAGTATKPPEPKWDEGLSAPRQGTERGTEQATDPRLETEPATKPAAAASEPDTDIGSGWKTQEEAIVSLNEAYAEGDYKRVAEVENAMWKRQFTGMAAPIIQRMHGELQEAIEEIRSQIADVIPDLRGTVVQKRFEADKSFVIDILRAKPDNTDLMESLFTEQDGPPIEFNGREYENTPYNRILIDNPYLLKIREEDKDPRVATRKTLHTRMEAALQIYRKEREGTMGPEKAKELVEAGKQIAARNGQDRARQNLNAGSGSKQTGGKPEKDYAQQLQDLPEFGAVDEFFR